jgi:hypothetical protein
MQQQRDFQLNIFTPLEKGGLISRSEIVTIRWHPLLDLLPVDQDTSMLVMKLLELRTFAPRS